MSPNSSWFPPLSREIHPQPPSHYAPLNHPFCFTLSHKMFVNSVFFVSSSELVFCLPGFPPQTFPVRFFFFLSISFAGALLPLELGGFFGFGSGLGVLPFFPIAPCSERSWCPHSLVVSFRIVTRSCLCMRISCRIGLMLRVLVVRPSMPRHLSELSLKFFLFLPGFVLLPPADHLSHAPVFWMATDPKSSPPEPPNSNSRIFPTRFLPFHPSWSPLFTASSTPRLPFPPSSLKRYAGRMRR